MNYKQMVGLVVDFPEQNGGNPWLNQTHRKILVTYHIPCRWTIDAKYHRLSLPWGHSIIETRTRLVILTLEVTRQTSSLLKTSPCYSWLPPFESIVPNETLGWTCTGGFVLISSSSHPYCQDLYDLFTFGMLIKLNCDLTAGLCKCTKANCTLHFVLHTENRIWRGGKVYMIQPQSGLTRHDHLSVGCTYNLLRALKALTHIFLIQNTLLALNWKK